MKKLSLILILLFSIITPLAAGDYVIIVNKSNSVSDISSSILKRLYTGRAKELGGNKVVPVNQVYTSPITASFLQEVTEKSPEEYKEFWVAQQIKGLGSAPMIQANDAAVINIVSAIPGAIGYISAGSATDAVKVITVK